jgi:nucleotide-binding universal stress UspA family protein
MKTIIVPTDFSSVSYNACLYAAIMAKDIKAELVLLHIAELPVAMGEYPVIDETFDSLKMETKLEELKEKLLSETGNKVNISSKNIFGSVEFEIKEFCDEKKPFAIIMGTHSYNWFDRFFIGSATFYTAKNLRYPVFVIPPNLKYKPFKKIALATDLIDIYEVPVHEIEMIVKLFNARLEIFYAGNDEKNINRNTVGGMLLNRRLKYLEPQFYFVEDKDIVRGIASLAEKHEIDLLIIIPKKHGLFHKSQSKDFIFHSLVPLIAIHENDLVEQV